MSTNLFWRPKKTTGQILPTFAKWAFEDNPIDGHNPVFWRGVLSCTRDEADKAEILELINFMENNDNHEVEFMIK